MKIIGIQIHNVRLPFRTPEPGGRTVARTVVELISDLGLTGLGEASGGVEAGIWEEVRSRGIGADPHDMTVIRESLREAGEAGALACVETACLDLVGKAAGLPVWRLLGGRLRRRLRLVPVIPWQPPEGLAGDAGALVDRHGFKALTVKVAGDAARAVQALRARLGAGVSLRLDAGGGTFDGLEELEADWIIDPPEDRLVGEASPAVAVRLGEAGWAGVAEAVRAGGVAGVLVDAAAVGGPAACRSMADCLTARGLRIGLQGGPETGVGLAARLHLAAALPALDLDVESAFHDLADDVLKFSLLEHRDGSMFVPPGPGLGITLDPEKVRALSG